MDIIKSNEITSGLEKEGRIYLCGDLKRPSDFRYIPTSGYEIGISDYPEYTFEKAHVHTFSQEYNYILEGAVKIFLLDEKNEYELHKGDLFVIHTNEPYVGKAQAGTKTIFSKVPGGNDKKLIPMDEALVRWGNSWDSIYAEV